MKYLTEPDAWQLMDDAEESLQIAESFLEAHPALPMSFNTSFALEYLRNATRELRLAGNVRN